MTSQKRFFQLLGKMSPPLLLLPLRIVYSKGRYLYRLSLGSTGPVFFPSEGHILPSLGIYIQQGRHFSQPLGRRLATTSVHLSFTNFPKILYVALRHLSRARNNQSPVHSSCPFILFFFAEKQLLESKCRSNA